jgi:hypothetical protein
MLGKVKYPVTGPVVAQMGVEVQLYSSKTSALEGMSGKQHAPAALYPGKEPVPILQEVGWAPGPVWMSEKTAPSSGIWSPDRPARSQWLYWLSYPAHRCLVSLHKFSMDCLYLFQRASAIRRPRLIVSRELIVSTTVRRRVKLPVVWCWRQLLSW